MQSEADWADAPPDDDVLVSVVIPCFNGSPFIERAINSVLGQTHQPVEAIVVDDGSTDASAALAAALARRDARVRTVGFARNAGVAQARNAGIACARGRYLAFLDADDYWQPRKLERQLHALREAGAALAFTAVDVHDAAGRFVGHRPVPERVQPERLLVHNVIATSSVLIDRMLAPQVRMPSLRLRQDLATWHGLLSAGVEAIGVNEPLVVYTKHRGSLSANKLVAAQANWHLYRRHLDRDFPSAAALFVRYAVAASLRV